MSLLLSTGLLVFFMNWGSAEGFFMMLIMFASIIPFLFDGVMSIMSAYRGKILTASPEVTEVTNENEDDFQQQKDENDEPSKSSEILMPDLWKEHPDLANRITTDWK